MFSIMDPFLSKHGIKMTDSLTGQSYLITVPSFSDSLKCPGAHENLECHGICDNACETIQTE